MCQMCTYRKFSEMLFQVIMIIGEKIKFNILKNILCANFSTKNCLKSDFDF